MEASANQQEAFPVSYFEVDLQGVLSPGAKEDYAIRFREAVVEDVFVSGVGVSCEGDRALGGIRLEGEVAFCAIVHAADAGIAVGG